MMQVQVHVVVGYGEKVCKKAYSFALFEPL